MEKLTSPKNNTLRLSLRNAGLQRPRVAQARKVSADKVARLIRDYTEGPDLGFWENPGLTCSG